MDRTTSILHEALPEKIPFYHLGMIEASESRTAEGIGETLSPDRSALAYALQGDLQALLLLTMESGLDLSVYAEAGNLLASQVATRLSQQNGLDVMISPPRQLDADQLATLARRLDDSEARILLEKIYIHLHGEHAVSLRLLFITNDTQNGTNLESEMARQGVGHV